MGSAAARPQFADYITVEAFHEIHSLATGAPIPASWWGPERAMSCGMGYITHHPMLWTFVGAAVERLGGSPAWALAAFVAAAAALLVATARTGRGAAACALSIALAFQAPGLGAWLAHPVGHTAAVGAAFVILAACACRRPTLPVAAATLLAGLSSIDATGLFVGAVAGGLLARHRVGWGTARAAVAAVGAFLLANALHVAPRALRRRAPPLDGGGVDVGQITLDGGPGAAYGGAKMAQWVTCTVVGDGENLIHARYIVRASPSPERGYLEMWVAEGQNIRVLRVINLLHPTGWRTATLDGLAELLRGT